MITRNVTIERDGAYWLVHIDGTSGLTQARRYGEVELMAREYVALVEDVNLKLGASKLRSCGPWLGVHV